MPKAERAKTRTVNISPRAADMIAVLAKDAHQSARAFVDAVLMPHLEEPYRAALQRRLGKAAKQRRAAA
jgi:hypothetical protein